MKKFMKVCAIMAAILVVLGAALAYTAGTFRGREVVSDVVDSVTGGRVHVNWSGWNIPWGVTFRDDWHFDLNTSNVYDKDYEIYRGDVTEHEISGEFSQLDIELGGYIFETAVSPDDSFYLTTNNADKFQCYVKKGVLYLTAVNSGINISLGNISDRKLTLYIPEGTTLSKVEVELGAGQVIIDGLNAETVSLEVGAGQIQAKNIQAGKLEVSVGAGQIELPGMKVDELKAEIGMGELVGSGSIDKSADLECSMGNLELTLTGSQKDFNYQLEVAAGNLDLGSNSYSGLATEQKLLNPTAVKTMDIECAMGNVTISFEE